MTSQSNIFQFTAPANNQKKYRHYVKKTSFGLVVVIIIVMFFVTFEIERDSCYLYLAFLSIICLVISFAKFVEGGVGSDDVQ